MTTPGGYRPFSRTALGAAAFVTVCFAPLGPVDAYLVDDDNEAVWINTAIPHPRRGEYINRALAELAGGQDRPSVTPVDLDGGSRRPPLRLIVTDPSR